MHTPQKLLRKPKTTKAVRGVTLIELLVVVAIVALLASIAFPSYQDHVMRTYRASAKACLTEHAHFMERYYTTNMSYTGAAPNLGCTNERGLGARYTFAVNDIAARAYTATATAIGAQATRDTQCGNLSIDQAGTKSISGSGAVSNCW